MMNKQNLVSKEKLEFKFKDVIPAELCLKLWFERDFYFSNNIESEWF